MILNYAGSSYARSITNKILLVLFYFSSPINLHAQASLCGLDEFEPNNFRAKAKNISTQFKHGRDIEAQTCQYDHDWYSFWLDKGQLVQVTLDSTQAFHMPSIQIFAPRKRKSSGILRRKKHQQSVKVYAKNSGRYRIKVSSKEALKERYILRLQPLKSFR